MIKIRNLQIDNKLQEQYQRIKYLYCDNLLTAEEVGVRYYNNCNYYAHITENTFWWEILSLLFWDVIFAKVDSALSDIEGYGIAIYYRANSKEFEDAFQKQVVEENGMPNDLFTRRFWINRQKIIENRINELLEIDLLREIKKLFQKNFNKKCRLIEDWQKYKLKEIVDIIKYFNNNEIISICVRLLRNLNYNRSGLPDLTIIGPNGVFFSEVKSENDRISQNQVDWLKFLNEQVKIRTEILVINHTKLQIRNLILKYRTNYKNVYWSFGNSKSKNREKAIQIISSQDSFHTTEEKDGLKYSATFCIKDIKTIFLMLDYTGRWNTTKIQIDNEEISSSELRYSLRCYRDKTLNGAYSEWCVQSRVHINAENPFSCRGFIFPEFDFNSWRDCGCIDVERGIWIFEIPKIKKRIDEEIHALRFCPFLNIEKIKNAINTLPKTVNPKTDKYWVFVDHRCHRWFWHKNSWYDTIINIRRQFPGYDKVIGIEKISDSQANSIINDLKYYT